MGGCEVAFGVDGKVQMITLISEEQRDACSSTQSIVVCKFRKRKQGVPVILLIIAEYPEVLFQGLVSPFCLSVAFQMVSRSEVKLHVQCFSERPEKSRDELGTTVGGDMFRNAVLREHVHHE